MVAELLGHALAQARPAAHPLHQPLLDQRVEIAPHRHVMHAELGGKVPHPDLRRGRRAPQDLLLPGSGGFRRLRARLLPRQRFLIPGIKHQARAYHGGSHKIQRILTGFHT